MNNTTYNLDFTITHNDNLVFEVDASSREAALETGIQMIHNQMEGFPTAYDIELNSCVEQGPSYVPFQSQNTPQDYVSLAQYYSTAVAIVQDEPDTPPSLPPIPGYSRFTN